MKIEGTQGYRNLLDPAVLIEDIDSLHHLDLDILAFEIFTQHIDKKRNSTGIDLLEDRATQDQLME